jgi:hypothetical protein
MGKVSNNTSQLSLDNTNQRDNLVQALKKTYLSPKRGGTSCNEQLASTDTEIWLMYIDHKTYRVYDSTQPDHSS